ncbi:glycosyltransferase [Roseospira navarrensis]|uniref:Glycosyltransferase n=1 Tax=Roseospira navarrensis TaxID=140058 RepID=A0A7X1ZDK3_9PROT|nr:glycosyltransferase [Roseospira navarrensis]MQX36372.1 glycosyltransferase [Roseospira navarrensis]
MSGALRDPVRRAEPAPDRPPRVLHVMRTYGAHGGETQLSRYFSTEPRGAVEEHFAFIYRDDDCRRLFEAAGARVRTHDLWRRPLAPDQSPWAELARLAVRLPGMAWRLGRLLRRLKPRIVVVHGFQAALVVWPFGMMGRGRRYVYIHRIAKRHGRRAVFRLLYAPYDRAAGVSHAVTDSLAPLFGREKLVTLDNGVEIDALRAAAQGPTAPAAPDGPVFVCVGRLLAHKRQDWILRAFAQVRSATGTGSLWIVGDGPERAALETLARDLGIAEAVTAWGYRSDVGALLGGATVFLHASNWEGMSNAVLEGMAMGLPSVVIDAPGVTECHIDGETGLIVPPSVDALAAGMRRLLADPDAAARMGQAAAQRAETQYSTRANRARFLDLYDTLMAET